MNESDDSGHGTYPKRFYLNVEAKPPDVAYAPRPIPGSVADLDVLMQHCDVSDNRYVRDCLEVLSVGAGLDKDGRVRRPVPDGWKYLFVEDSVIPSIPTRTVRSLFSSPKDTRDADRLLDAKFIKKLNAEWEPSPISLPPTQKHHVYSSIDGPCDPNDPRIFHTYWTGPFTDKPYFAIISFLFTQNLGLHEPDYEDERHFCRPQLWLWINPDSAAAQPSQNFKFWNTTEQLDSLPELKLEKRRERIQIPWQAVFERPSRLLLVLVLRPTFRSALGTFLLRTALKNELDFHPIPASNYVKHGKLDALLYRAPGALFDPAWMNADGYQRGRPPQPYFKRCPVLSTWMSLCKFMSCPHKFTDFFDTPSPARASPQALGFDSFFKGAFAYHYHNSWWKPVDPGQNWPNLGQFGNITTVLAEFSDPEQDLSWSTVLKRTFEAYIRGERPNMSGEWILP
ncbi:snoRNA binding protein [Armillaria fumosa]|nr:snoRNA binding protein [Armillaria fumosa]